MCINVLDFTCQIFLQIFPGVLFVTIYSLLPHKELRFLFPVLPIFVAAAAVGLEKIKYWCFQPNDLKTQTTDPGVLMSLSHSQLESDTSSIRQRIKSDIHGN